ncbi:MAG: 30S ribosomal protein S9 [Candidatus Parcubacteria bacterium]|nr:MAG: 30S ribosomal protein S9 [Candidatus Parcubacteria bacterium]
METKVEEVKTLEIEKETEEPKTEVSFPLIEKGRYFEGIGRRKRATARVRIWQNDANKDFNILINDRNYKDYFKNIEFQKIVEAPLRKIKAQKIYKVTCKVIGGGPRGQAEAIRLGLARSLVLLNPEWKPKFKKAGFLTRDPREVERKKYGKRKARKEEQWQKR